MSAPVIAQPMDICAKKNGISLRWNRGFAAQRNALLLRGQQQLDTAVTKALCPYMPRDSGRMMNSMFEATRPGSGVVVVNTSYARAVYYGRAVQGRNGPLRGPYYFNRMAAAYSETLRRRTAEEMGCKT